MLENSIETWDFLASHVWVPDGRDNHDAMTLWPKDESDEKWNGAKWDAHPSTDLQTSQTRNSELEFSFEHQAVLVGEGNRHTFCSKIYRSPWWQVIQWDPGERTPHGLRMFSYPHSTAVMFHVAVVSRRLLSLRESHAHPAQFSLVTKEVNRDFLLVIAGTLFTCRYIQKVSLCR